MVTIVFPSWASALFIAFEAVFFVCCLHIGRPQKPLGLDDPTFAAVLDRMEQEAIAADEAEYARRRQQQMEHGFRDIFGLSAPTPMPAPASVMREIDAVAAYAWWAREPDDGEDEAPA